MSSKVYVGNLGDNTSRTELEGAFGKYGRLASVWVARNPPGFAFVEFEDPRDAEDAVRQMDGTRLCGVRIRVEMSRVRRRGGPPPNRRGRYSGYKSRSRSPVRRRSRSITRSRSRSISRPRNHRSRSDSNSRDRASFVLQRVNGKEDCIKEK